jgi:cytochrome bd-type quinol oxidase subunit 2
VFIELSGVCIPLLLHLLPLFRQKIIFLFRIKCPASRASLVASFFIFGASGFACSAAVGVCLCYGLCLRAAFAANGLHLIESFLKIKIFLNKVELRPPKKGKKGCPSP